MNLFKHTIKAHSDFELANDIQRNLDYSVALPDDGEIKGLVVYIAGFGEDAGEYRKNFQNFICKDYQMACLSVDHHCLFCRPNNGAAVIIEMETLKLLRSITGLDHHVSMDDLLVKAAEIKAEKSTPLIIPATLYPAKNEYQNFGILPAIDNIFAINDIYLKYPHIPKTIFAIGSSYGGYIANLISKLAPNTLNAVFDNSSWALPNLKYIKGQELGSYEMLGTLFSNVTLELNVLSPWTHNPHLPNYFNQARRQIRSFPDDHLRIMAGSGKNKTIYRFVHAKEDSISDAEDKISLADSLKKNGFDVQMEVYTDKDIDGHYIKNMEHGMRMSMKSLFARAFERSYLSIRSDQRIDFDFNHILHYPCDMEIYTITYKKRIQPKCTLIKRNPPH